MTKKELLEAMKNYQDDENIIVAIPLQNDLTLTATPHEINYSTIMGIKVISLDCNNANYFNTPEKDNL